MTATLDTQETVDGAGTRRFLNEIGASSTPSDDAKHPRMLADAPRRRTRVWIGDLGDELNRVYRSSKGPELIEVCDERVALTTATALFWHLSENGPLAEFTNKFEHTPAEQDAIVRLAMATADKHAPLGDSIVVARHLSFWSDWSQSENYSCVGLNVTYWLCEDHAWFDWVKGISL